MLATKIAAILHRRACDAQWSENRCRWVLFCALATGPRFFILTKPIVRARYYALHIFNASAFCGRIEMEIGISSRRVCLADPGPSFTITFQHLLPLPFNQTCTSIAIVCARCAHGLSQRERKYLLASDDLWWMRPLRTCLTIWLTQCSCSSHSNLSEPNYCHKL